MRHPFWFKEHFFPLFWVQFLGAFNDNLFKNALVMLITFRLADSPEQAGILITMAAGFFILPFFLFSAFAGQLADKYEKTWLIRKIKLAEVLIMLLGAMALTSESVAALLGVLFLMGVQSAFFGPIKYAILPEHLPEKQLLEGNGWFSASTFVAILLGTILGGWGILTESGQQLMAWALLTVAVLGVVASRFVPYSKSSDSTITLQWNFIANTIQEMRLRKRFPEAFFAVLAISWFWFLGATYLSQMPIMVSNVLGGDDQVVLLFLTGFSIGIAIGAWLAHRFQPRVKALSDVLWLGWLLIGMSVMILVANVMMTVWAPTPDEPLAMMAFLQQWQAWFIWVLLVAIAAVGGAFCVPLYTLLQVQTAEHFRSRMVAVNNITNALLMVLSALLVLLLYGLGADVVDLFYAIALLNLLAAFWYFRHGSGLIKNRKTVNEVGD